MDKETEKNRGRLVPD